MLELHITDTNVTGGSIQVSWCLTKEALTQLADRGVKDPYIVFCVAPFGERYSEHKESRMAVPLKDMMAYLGFSCSGQNQIRAWLCRSKKEAHNFLEKSNGEYDFTVLNNDGSDYRGWNLERMCLIGPEWIPNEEENKSEDDGDHEARVKINYSKTSLAKAVTVFVPEGCFAPEPAQWEKTWVNHFFRNKCVDQCDFRRRRLFAYTLQPLVMTFNILLRFLILVFAILFGSRNLSLKYLLHPLTYGLTDSHEMFVKGTIFVLRTKYTVVNFLPLILMPYVLGVLFVLHMAKILWMFLAILAVAGVLVFLIASGITGHWGDRIVNWLSERFDSDEKFWYTDEEERDLIICTGQMRPVKLSALPARHRTIKLRFYDLKSKVCRPFSK
jgi:hypothetical protein